jgi:hypothetical protein
MRMSLQGKGYYIWKVRNCEGGNPDAILKMAKEANLGHVLIKVADGGRAYNIDKDTQKDLAAPVVSRLIDAGLGVWGWQYVYGDNPIAEAQIAVKRIRELGLQGYVVDAEIEYKDSGKAEAARTYMKEIRRSFPNLPIALSSYRFPSYHKSFPYAAFLEYCDYNMPQVYWEGAHNPDYQLRKSVREFQNFKPYRPIYVTGAAYTNQGWTSTAADVKLFLETCKELNIEAANFWYWNSARTLFPKMWDAIAAFDWPTSLKAQQPDNGNEIVEEYISALNNHDPVEAAVLYQPEGVHINAERTTQGMENILIWYFNLFSQKLIDAKFELTKLTGTGNSRQFSWSAISPNGIVKNGSDTFGFIDGKISYHYSYFTIE